MLSIRTQYIYVSKDVDICGYFSKPKGVREKKKFGKHWYNHFHGAEFLTENSSSDSQEIPSF